MTPYERFRPAFAQMLDPRKWPLAWLDKEIASGRATAFGNDQGCIIAALRRFPGGLIEVHGLAATGNLPEIARLIVEAERWGREHGAEIATIASRRGWARTLKDAGYSEVQVMIEKRIAEWD